MLSVWRLNLHHLPQRCQNILNGDKAVFRGIENFNKLDHIQYTGSSENRILTLKNLSSNAITVPLVFCVVVVLGFNSALIIF